MNRHDEIKNAYRSLGKEAAFYDGMITCSALPGKAVWGGYLQFGFNRKEQLTRIVLFPFLTLLLAWICMLL